MYWKFWVNFYRTNFIIKSHSFGIDVAFHYQNSRLDTGFNRHGNLELFSVTYDFLSFTYEFTLAFFSLFESTEYCKALSMVSAISVEFNDSKIFV